MDKQRISDLKAVANLMPPKPFSLRVSCDVLANKGQTAELVKATPQGINPKILILDVVIHGRGAQPGNISARYEDASYDDQYDEVTARYDSEAQTVKVERVF
jgi:hypothetical protein